MKRRFLHIIIAFDQFAWVILTLGAGYPDETISSSAYRYEKQGHWFGRARPIIDGIFFWQKQHCRKAYLAEKFRRQISLDLR